MKLIEQLKRKLAIKLLNSSSLPIKTRLPATMPPLIENTLKTKSKLHKNTLLGSITEEMKSTERDLNSLTRDVMLH